MNPLDAVPTDQLTQEIERRRSTAAVGPPAIIENPDLTKLRTMVQEGLAKSIADGYEDEDLSHYIYEAVMTMFYGAEYWPWRNSRRW